MKTVDCFMEENNRRAFSLHGSHDNDTSTKRRNGFPAISAADPGEFEDVYGSEERDEDLKVIPVHGAKPGWRKIDFKKSLEGRR